MAVTLERRGATSILMVDGQPHLMLAGETHNSSSSSLDYMETVWDQAVSLGLNTVLLPVSWELVEPQEGVFDFELVDGLIAQARQRDMKIAMLWFGAWKNAQCYYAPEWVKTDLARFERAQVVKGHNHTNLTDFHNMPYSTLSYLCDATCQADARAFATLMAHLKRVDGDERTVVMVQVENETGIKVVYASFSTNEEMYASLGQKTNQYDIILCSDYIIQQTGFKYFILATASTAFALGLHSLLSRRLAAVSSAI